MPLLLLLFLCLFQSLHATEVGGTITTNTYWTSAANPYVVTNDINVATNVMLTIESGVMVRLHADVSILAQAGGTIDVQGTSAEPVSFGPFNGSDNWKRLGAVGRAASLTLRHAELDHGQVAVLNGASGLFEHCFFHDYHTTAPITLYTQPILISEQAPSLFVRACHFQNYYETLFRLGVIVIEDSLFEDVTGDGVDFDTAAPGSVIRRCTLRHGPLDNVDAVDLGSQSRGVLVEDCLMQDFPFDKGVSIGEQSTDITVRGCVICGVNIGVAVKDSSVADIIQNTIADCTNGLSLYQKTAGQGGGHATAWNNILWNNANSITLLNGSTLSVDFSDISGPEVYAGTGNLNATPLFREAGLRDFRLATNSPCIGTGTNGTTMGALFPVGSPLVDTDADGLPDTWEQTYDLDFNDPADATLDRDRDGLANEQEFLAGTSPNDAGDCLRIESIAATTNGAAIGLRAVEGHSYSILYCSGSLLGPWLKLADVPTTANTTNLQFADPIPGDVRTRFYRVVTPIVPEP